MTLCALGQVPVWMGGCAWQQFVPAYNKDPSKYPQVVDYLNQGLTQAEHQMSFPDQGGHCPDMLSEAIPKLMSYWDVVDHTNVSLRQRRHHHHHCDTTPTCNIHGSQAHKQLTYVPNTLKMAIGADNASTVVSAQIHVQVSVPFEIHGCKKVFFGHCECKTVCGGIVYDANDDEHAVQDLSDATCCYSKRCTGNHNHPRYSKCSVSRLWQILQQVSRQGVWHHTEQNGIGTWSLHQQEQGQNPRSLLRLRDRLPTPAVHSGWFLHHDHHVTHSCRRRGRCLHSRWRKRDGQVQRVV